MVFQKSIVMLKDYKSAWNHVENMDNYITCSIKYTNVAWKYD